MARREYDYIKGNTVLAPERKSRVRKPDEKTKQLQRRSIIKKNLILRDKRKSDRKYLVTVAVVIFTLGFITISGDNKVYTMENKVSNLNSQISQTEEANEALKVKILKFSSLSNIQQNAESKLSMFIPKKEQTVKVDFSKNYFEDLEPKTTENNAKSGNILSKLMNLIK